MAYRRTGRRSMRRRGGRSYARRRVSRRSVRPLRIGYRF